MSKKEILIVGGDIEAGRMSGIARLIADHFICTPGNVCSIYNGKLPSSIEDYDLTVWMPDIPNETPKNYPVKKQGSVLICSKVMRPGYTKLDAVSRIFKMGGNAVVAIRKNELIKHYEFELIDALGNTWIKTSQISELCESILELYDWTANAERISLTQHPMVPFVTQKLAQHKSTLTKFIGINNQLADKVQKSYGDRYFGNLSTRCMKLFPSSCVEGDVIFMSPRNVDKSKLGYRDFVATNSMLEYYGERKPSVDSPVQIELFHNFRNINYMIHGHAFIKGAQFTQNYFPCGDMREVDEINEIFNTGCRVLNLKNHGFLIASRDLQHMQDFISGTNGRSELKFKPL